MWNTKHCYLLGHVAYAHARKYIGKQINMANFNSLTLNCPRVHCSHLSVLHHDLSLYFPLYFSMQHWTSAFTFTLLLLHRMLQKNKSIQSHHWLQCATQTVNKQSVNDRPSGVVPDCECSPQHFSSLLNLWTCKHRFLISSLSLSLSLSLSHTHTHTRTHVGFCGLRGLSIGVMVFILYKLYVLLPYTYPTPKLSPHRRLCASLDFQKTPFSMFFKPFDYGDIEYNLKVSS